MLPHLYNFICGEDVCGTGDMPSYASSDFHEYFRMMKNSKCLELYLWYSGLEPSDEKRLKKHKR